MPWTLLSGIVTARLSKKQRGRIQQIPKKRKKRTSRI